jgi:hypothetical protein
MIDGIPQEMLPIYAQKNAENMTVHSNKRILFLLITPDRVPTECVWLEPSFGFFAVKGREDVGYLTIKQLPEGSLIINQRYEVNEK